MSANNEILIKKIRKKWRVVHNDMDCGELKRIGEFDNLEEAIDKAHEFTKMCNENGYGIEYGLRIIR